MYMYVLPGGDAASNATAVKEPVSTNAAGKSIATDDTVILVNELDWLNSAGELQHVHPRFTLLRCSISFPITEHTTLTQHACISEHACISGAWRAHQSHIPHGALKSRPYPIQSLYFGKLLLLHYCIWSSSVDYRWSC